MLTLARRMATAILALTAVLAVLATPALAADDDEIRNLSVTYEIQPDGAVKVRHEAQWRFGDSGRHGIDFSIATRERYGQGSDQDAVYDVSNIAVDSPSGAPAQFTQEDHDGGYYTSIDLRIGDPEVALKGRDATYVISYTVRGALRTVDDRPEFFWDVTSQSNPRIEKFKVRVTAPKGVTRARCLVGSAECESSVEAGQATMTGKNVPRRKTISVVAGLEPGAVARAEPTLERTRITSPRLDNVDSVVEVREDGLTHVEQELTYRLPYDYASSSSYIRWTLPTRRPFTSTEDYTYNISKLKIDGADKVREDEPSERELRSSTQELGLTVTPEQTSEITVVRLSYDVQGAVHSSGGKADASWILLPDDSYEPLSGSFTWKTPGRVERTSCLRVLSRVERNKACAEDPDLVSDGNTVSWEPSIEDDVSANNTWISHTFDASAVGNATALLEPSLDAAARRLAIGSGVAAVVAFLLLSGTGVLIGRAAITKDSRWADVPPGVSAPEGSPVQVAGDKREVPVRFEEPDSSLATAGLVLDQRPRPQHTAAILVHMASVGALTLQSSPLVLNRISDEGLTDPLEISLYKGAKTQDGDKALLRRLNAVVAKQQASTLENRSLFGPSTPDKKLRRNLRIALFLLIAGVLIGTAFAPEWLGQHTGWIVAGVVVGALVGAVVSTRFSYRAPLAPNGYALREQVEGFRHYLATAEAHQLDYEAGEDIYRRYLPWAVLFGLTERWTKVCDAMAAAERIPTQDTSSWNNAGDAHAIAVVSSTLSSQLQSAGTPSASSGYSDSGGSGSSGGSGGGSGFSGGSSGGGGGGGTSSGSW